MAVRLLVLAGTAEARELCHLLVAEPAIDVTASLAGLLATNTSYPVTVRTGGFGGAAGLATFLRSSKVDILVDATHPFASRISLNAAHAASQTDTTLLRLVRPEWRKRASDHWTDCLDVQEAFDLLPARARVLAALGSGLLRQSSRHRLRWRADIRVIVRVFDSSNLGKLSDNCTVVVATRLADLATEMKFLRDRRITHLVCRNSGGRFGQVKLDAAAALGVPVLMIRRPLDNLDPGGALVFDDSRKLYEFIMGAERRLDCNHEPVDDETATKCTDSRRSLPCVGANAGVTNPVQKDTSSRT